MIKVVLNQQTMHDVSVFTFNDGSVQIKIEGDIPEQITLANVQAQVQTPEYQMALVNVINALRTLSPIVEIHLMMPFCPYGRQDDAFVRGEANGMKAWAGVVNSLNLDSVAILDPHSSAINFIDNLLKIDQLSIVTGVADQIDFPNVTLVSPDAGANKKAHKLCREFGIKKLVRADKAREVTTGRIIETELYGEVEGDTCVIVDDICDGGMTFIKLAEKLREKGAEKIVLVVTHGLFTKGLSVFEGLIDEIYTTDSWIRSEGFDEGYSGKFISIG